MNTRSLPVVRLEQKVLVVEQVGAELVDDDQVGRAEDDQVDGLQGGDHHLVDGAGDEDQQHAVGEILEIFLLTEAPPQQLQSHLGEMSRRKLHLTNSFSFCLVPVDNGNVGKDTLAMACIVLSAQSLLGRHVVHFVVFLVDSVDTLVNPGVVHVKLK